MTENKIWTKDKIEPQHSLNKNDKSILIDTLMCSIPAYFYELSSILLSQKVNQNTNAE